MVTYGANYTFAKNLATAASWNNNLVDPVNLRNDYNPVPYDRTQVFNIHYLVDLGQALQGRQPDVLRGRQRMAGFRHFAGDERVPAGFRERRELRFWLRRDFADAGIMGQPNESCQRSHLPHRVRHSARQQRRDPLRNEHESDGLAGHPGHATDADPGRESPSAERSSTSSSIHWPSACRNQEPTACTGCRICTGRLTSITT